MTVELGPLTYEQSAALVGHLAMQATCTPITRGCDRIAVQCDGNPMFAEMILDVFGRPRRRRIPPTIPALLSARLDRLSGRERRSSS